MCVGFCSRRRPLRSSLFGGRGAHSRSWPGSCRSALKRDFKGNPVLREGCERQSCATRGLLKASLRYEKAFKGNPVLREGSQRQSCATRGPLKAIVCFRLELSTASSRREPLGRQERTVWTAWEATGRQERTNWTASL